MQQHQLATVTAIHQGKPIPNRTTISDMKLILSPGEQLAEVQQIVHEWRSLTIRQEGVYVRIIHNQNPTRGQQVIDASLSMTSRESLQLSRALQAAGFNVRIAPCENHTVYTRVQAYRAHPGIPS